MIQTVQQERQWWNVAGPEDLWNGPGDGLEHVGIIMASLQGIPEGQVLDLACGDGRLLARMAELHPNRYHLGLDIIPRPLGYPIPPNASTALGDGRTIPLLDESCAAVYSVLLFQHLPEEAIASYLREAYRVLKPGGRFVFQFVAWTDGGGYEGSFLNYRHVPGEVADWCSEIGFRSSASAAQAIDANDWCWLTVQKGPA